MTLSGEVVDWETHPEAAFAAFIRSDAFSALSCRPARTGRTPPVLRNSSIRLYCYYFGRFLAWAEKERLDWITASSVDLRRFLDTPPEQGGRQSRHSTIRQRYLRLLERVYTRLGIEPNPATHAIYEMVMAGERGKDRMKSYLTDREAIAFMSALPIAQPFDEGRPDFTGWKNRRDRALLAVMLGAGLKVSEAVTLPVDAVGEPLSSGDVPVTLTTTRGNGIPHRSPCRAFAVPALLAWRKERLLLGIPGTLLFPATSKGDGLERTGVYKTVRATLSRAGIGNKRLGPRTLRNTFAVAQLSAGHSVEVVSEWLGHRTLKSTRLYLSRP